jgi:hypothetical protein
MGLQGKALKDSDFNEAATALGVEKSVLKAITKVESSGRGFAKDGKPIILFEAHWFDRYTKGQYRESHPRISSVKWNRKLYTGTQAGEWDRFTSAEYLNKDAAVLSTSWGLFQIMGFNYRMCGFVSVADFRVAMERDEKEHLLAVIKFLGAKGLVPELKARDWHGFAQQYNGPGYMKNNYVEKLEKAYNFYANPANRSKWEVV